MPITIVWRDKIYALALAAVVLLGAAAFGFSRGDGGSSLPVLATAPTAVPTATRSAQPTPEATPTTGAQSALDARRIDDLHKIAAALDTYRTRSGAYPSSDGVTQWACKTGLEAACAIAGVQAGLHFNDGSYDYLYRSDGTTYTLFTRLDTAVSDNGCAGRTLPAELAGAPAYCIGS